MDEKLISIITPVYNSDKYIIDTINSVLSQTYQNWQLILVDDGSRDASIKIIDEFRSKDSRIEVIKNPQNIGPARSRNKGIERATGDYIAFLDSDDIWLPEFLETMISFSVANDYDFVFSSYKRTDENLNPLYKDFIVPEKVNYDSLLKTCPISCLTALINISSIGKYYMPDIDKRQDYGLWLSILKDVEYAYGFTKPLAIYRIRKGSVSRNKFKAMLYVWRIYRDVEKLNFFYSLYLLVNYAYSGYRKYSD